MGTVRRKVPDILKRAQEYLFARSASLERASRYDAAKKPVRQWLLDHGEKDEEGNLSYSFPGPITATDGKTYSGVMLKFKAADPYIDAEDAKEFILARWGLVDDLGKADEVYDRVFPKVETFDVDQLYLMVQEGEISEEDLRKLMTHPKGSYSLWPVEATEPMEDE